MYHHRQIGSSTIIAFVAAAVLILYLTPPAAISIALPILLAVGVLFGSLSISIEHNALRWHFGLGFLKQEVPLSEITEVHEIRTRWYDGSGVRVIREGTLYNVSGLSAVQVILRNNRKVCLGTDEPAKLARAIRNRANLAD